MLTDGEEVHQKGAGKHGLAHCYHDILRGGHVWIILLEGLNTIRDGDDGTSGHSNNKVRP